MALFSYPLNAYEFHSTFQANDQKSVVVDFAECYNTCMKKSEVIAYLNRWQSVERIEKEEAQAHTVQKRWLQLNSLFGLALALNLLDSPSDTGEEAIWQRWVELKEKV